jgi:hypothetical protein
MKIVGLSLNQFMRVEAVQMTFAPSGVITIAGENGSGKTSVETFIELCFGGKDKCPPLPVKVGQKKALGKLTLDDEGHCVTVEVAVEPDRSVKAVVRQDGGPPFDGPVTMLKALVSKFTFNPFALMRLTGQEQRRVMLDCLGVNFDDLEAQAEKIKEERKAVGRDRNGRERQIATMPEYQGVPAKEVSTVALAGELSKLSDMRLANDQKRAEAKRLAAGVKTRQEQLEAADVDVAHCEQMLKAAQDKRAKLAEMLTQEAKSAEVATAAAAALTDPDPEPIKAKMASADETNKKVRANAARAALVAQYQQDHDRYKELGEKLAGVERAKQDRLNAGPAPVEGLEFRDDGVWYKGLPLSQDMESDQMIRSIQLAAALNPKLRTIVLNNGERMLPAKMKELDAWAEANDYQIILFRASTTAAGCEFYLEEGRVQGADDEAPPPGEGE